MDADALEQLAAKVSRSLHWAAFLLLMMGVILIIDLQLKKSIARQAVAAAELLSEVRYGRPAPGTPDDPIGGGGGGDDVGGDAGLAAPDGDSPGQVPGPEGGGVDGAPVRSPGDGRRARRSQ